MPDETATNESNTDGNTPDGSTSTAGDEFKPITSQEEFNDRLKDRLARETAKFSDYKDVKAKAARFDELEAANKTETQKLNERLAAAEATAEASRVEALRFRIAAKHKVSDEDAALFLTGTDEEALTAQAARLSALDADRKKNGARASREGGNPPAGTPTDERATARALFGSPG